MGRSGGKLSRVNVMDQNCSKFKCNKLKKKKTSKNSLTKNKEKP